MEVIGKVGNILMRYGLALIIIWIGSMKFTGYEAEAIKPLVASSPLMGWIYSILEVKTFAIILGITQIIIGILIAIRPFLPKLSIIGGLLAAFMFLGTLSFIFTANGWEASLGGFPYLSVIPGQFLIKDLVLLGVALWSSFDAYTASQEK